MEAASPALPPPGVGLLTLRYQGSLWICERRKLTKRDGLNA